MPLVLLLRQKYAHGLFHVRFRLIERLQHLQGLERLLPSDAKASYTKSQPLGRFGHVRDIADATVYLFSDAGSYVTGQTLVGKSLLLASSNHLLDC